MKTWQILVVSILIGTGSAAMAGEVKVETDEQKTIYSMGFMMARNLDSFALTPEEMEVLKAGLSDAAGKKEPKVPVDAFQPKIRDLAQARAKVVAEAEKKAAEDFLKLAAAEAGAVKSDSGMIYKEIKAGTGDTPKATDKVKVHYHGTLRDGTVFDSSVQRGQPVDFGLNQVIPCWTEGVQKIKVGGKAKLVCPSSIAYGDRGSPPKIKPGAALVFEVELLDIVKPAPAAAAPAAPAADKDKK